MITTKRYTSIDTKEVSLHLADHGWEQHEYAGAAPTKTPVLLARHRVIYRNRKRPDMQGVAIPEVVFINSHDGSSSARLHLALRTNCGRTTALPADKKVSVRHRIDAEDTLIEAMPKLLQQFADVESDVRSWKARNLSAAEMEEYARLGGQLRYGDGWTYEPETLLAPRAWVEDCRTDLWSVFCRLHANLVRGGFRGIAASGQGVTALPLSCIERDSKFNQTFWQLTKEML